MFCILFFCFVIVLSFTVLYCIVLYWIVLYCIVLYCIVLYCIVLYCFVLYCFVLYCIAFYCIALYFIVLSFILYGIVPYYIISYCCFLISNYSLLCCSCFYAAILLLHLFVYLYLNFRWKRCWWFRCWWVWFRKVKCCLKLFMGPIFLFVHSGRHKPFEYFVVDLGTGLHWLQYWRGEI